MDSVDVSSCYHDDLLAAISFIHPPLDWAAWGSTTGLGGCRTGELSVEDATATAFGRAGSARTGGGSREGEGARGI